MSRIGDFFRRDFRLDLLVQSVQGINQSIARINARQERMESTMSQLSDAVAALTAANAANHQELQLVLAAVHDFPAKIQAAIDQALAAGADPATLAAIQAAKDQQVADTKAMVDALAAPPTGTSDAGSTTAGGEVTPGPGSGDASGTGGAQDDVA